MKHWDVQYRTLDGREGYITVSAIQRDLAYDHAIEELKRKNLWPVDFSVSMVSMEDLGFFD